MPVRASYFYINGVFLEHSPLLDQFRRTYLIVRDNDAAAESSAL